MNCYIKRIEDFFLIGAFLVLYEPEMLKMSSIVHFFVQLYFGGLVIYIVINVVYRKIKFDNFKKCIFLYSIWMCICAFLSDSLSVSLIKLVGTFMIPAILYEYISYKRLVTIIFNSFEILMYSNLIYFYWFGERKSWLLTGSNALILYAIPSILVACIYTTLNEKNYLRGSILFVGATITAILSEAATNIILIILVVFFLLVQKTFCVKLFSAKRIIVVILLIMVFVVILRLHENIDVVRYIITEVFQRDITFTSRTFIWRTAIQRIQEAFWFGYGMDYVFKVSIGVTGFHADHAHNFYLQQFIQGGVMQFILFCFLNYTLLSKLEKFKNYKWYTFYFVMSILFLFESYTSGLIILIYIMLFYDAQHMLCIKRVT